MKTIISNGLIIGVATLVATFVINFITISIFPEFQTIYENTDIFREADDPLFMLYLLFPFALGFALAWVWNRVKHLFSGSLFKISWDFSILFLVVVGVPTFLIQLGSFNLPVMMMLSWLFTTYVNGYIAALILSKLNPP
ncbi:MAG: hypothetical protein GKR91_19520 [Pseudomonadales bacterium]|nr:hypothetical protein [Pseudomonadales bacterium]